MSFVPNFLATALSRCMPRPNPFLLNKMFKPLYFTQILLSWAFMMIYVADDRLKDFKIFVTNQNPAYWAPKDRHDDIICAVSDVALKAGETKPFDCKGEPVGRYVVIEQLKKEYLTLCEVEVMGGMCLNCLKFTEMHLYFNMAFGVI